MSTTFLRQGQLGPKSEFVWAPCRKQERGHFACLSCAETVPPMGALAFHTLKEGAHVVAWFCEHCKRLEQADRGGEVEAVSP